MERNSIPTSAELGEKYDQLSFERKSEFALKRYTLLRQLFDLKQADPEGFSEALKSGTMYRHIQSYLLDVYGVQTFKYQVQGLDLCSAGYSELLDVVVIYYDPDLEDIDTILSLKMIHECIHAIDHIEYGMSWRAIDSLLFTEDMAYVAIELLTDQPYSLRNDWTNSVKTFIYSYHNVMYDV